MEYTRLFQIDNDRHDFINWSSQHYVECARDELEGLVAEAMHYVTQKIPQLPKLAGMALDGIPETLGKMIGKNKPRKENQRFFQSLVDWECFEGDLDDCIEYFDEIFMDMKPHLAFMFQNMNDTKFGVMVYTMYRATCQIDQTCRMFGKDTPFNESEMEHLVDSRAYMSHVHKIRNITRGLAKTKFSELLEEYDKKFEREHNWLYKDLLRRHFPERVKKYLKVSSNIPYYLIDHVEVFNAKCAISIDLYQTMANEEKDEVKSKTWSKKHFEWCKALKENPYESRSPQSQKRAMDSADKMLSLYYNPINAYTNIKKYPSEIIDLYKY